MKKYDIDSEGNRVLLNSLVKRWNISGIDFEKSNYEAISETVITIRAKGGKMLKINIVDPQDIYFEIKR